MEMSLKKIIQPLLRKPETFIIDLIIILFIGFAFSQGLRITKDLSWPYDEDLYRNIGHAQTILDGDYFADDLYLGEKQWYNPLVPTIVAGLSWLTKTSVHILYTRMGAYLNLLAPIFFYILLVRFSDRWTALACTFGFLFVTSNGIPTWLGGSYSPWLLPVLFVQGLYYMALFIYIKALQTAKLKYIIISGILLGLVFMGHTAPAILLGLIMGITTLQTMFKTWKKREPVSQIFHPLGRLIILLLTAFIVSTPYHYSILGHYHLKIVHPDPLNMVFPPYQISNIGLFINRFASRPLLMIFVGIGLFGLILQKSKRTARNILLLWLIITIGFIIHNYIWQILKQHNINTVRILPVYHFVFYFRVMLSILYGYGMVFACRLFVKGLYHWKPLISRHRPLRFFLRPAIDKIILILLLMATSVKVYPSYMMRDDYREGRVYMEESPDFIAAFHWIQGNTQPGDVFLAPEPFSRFVVGAAGRKVVVVDPLFSNPYVDYRPRASDHDSLFIYLIEKNQDGFHDLASRYSLTHVISYDQTEAIDEANHPFIEKKFTYGQLSIYRYNRKQTI